MFDDIFDDLQIHLPDENSFEPSSTSAPPNTALHLAARNGHLEICGLLLALGGGQTRRVPHLLVWAQAAVVVAVGHAYILGDRAGGITFKEQEARSK